LDTTIELDPDDEVLVNWNAEAFTTTVQRDIAFFSVGQLVPPVRAYKHISTQGTPVEVLAQLISAMSGGASDPTTLFIRPTSGAAGHTLTPYAITDHGDGTNWAWVYDSEYPHDDFNPIEAYRYLVVDTVNNTWSYDWGGTSWSGDAGSHTFGIVPISLYAQQPQCPWCDNQTSAIDQAEVWLSVGGHLLISDSLGRHLGFLGGDYVSEIPSAYGASVDTGTENDLEPIYTLPLTETYSILLDGQTLTQTTPASVAQFGTGYSVQVSNLMVGPATANQLTITNDGKGVSLLTIQDQEPGLYLALDHPEENYVLSILGIDLASSEVITLSADTIAGDLILDGNQTSGGSYALIIRKVDSTGVAKFLHGNISLLATDTHIINYAAWMGRKYCFESIMAVTALSMRLLSWRTN
jgi:hypothetical protein